MSKAKHARAICIGALVAGGGFMAYAIPFVIVQMKKSQNTMSVEGPLSSSQIRRGVYLNTGSKDIGRDPDWDLVTKTYKGILALIPVCIVARIYFLYFNISNILHSRYGVVPSNNTILICRASHRVSQTRDSTVRRVACICMWPT